MSDILPKFLKRDKNAILFDEDGEFVFYVPEKYFDLKTAFSAGDYINILGILDYSIEDKNGKKGTLKQFHYPTRFLTKPYRIDKVKQVKLIGSSKTQDYRFLRYKKGDPVIVETKVPEEIENVEDFINLFVITGNIPNTIPCHKLQDYFINNMKYNGNSYNICLQIIGVMLSELCRSAKDPNIPFRLSGSKDMNDYQSISVKEVSKMVSPYSAITSENFDDSVVHAIMNDKKMVDSPLEKVMMGGK
jgi:hypothetical protein